MKTLPRISALSSVWTLTLLALFVCLLPTLGAAQSHSNTLTWTIPTQPTGVVISGFNVYKSSTSGGEVLGSPFATVSSGTVLTYTDTTPTSGQVNYYKVTALCATCSTEESAFSNEITLTTPVNGPPNAPTLTGTAK